MTTPQELLDELLRRREQFAEHLKAAPGPFREQWQQVYDANELQIKTQVNITLGGSMPRYESSS
jgi:hypothetical protein